MVMGIEKKTGCFNIVDLFSGAGGLSLGFQQEGFNLLLANDNDHDAIDTFQHNHPQVYCYEGDIKTLDQKRLSHILGGKKVNVLVAGIPCQSFSMKGQRILNVKRSDTRDSLFKEFMIITGIIKPEIVVIENVKGILSIHNGLIKETIINDLKKMGYKVNYKMLNAADYGVAQLRERVVFVANRIKKDNLFPEPTHSPENYVGVAKVLSNPSKYNHEPRELHGKVLERVKLVKPGKNWKSLPKELQTGSTHAGAYGRLDPKKPAFTLTTRFDTPPGGYVTHPTEDRAITVREGARIQSFPDDFIFQGKKISQYRQVGNAVPVSLARALAKTVKKMLMQNE